MLFSGKIQESHVTECLKKLLLSTWAQCTKAPACYAEDGKPSATCSVEREGHTSVRRTRIYGLSQRQQLVS